MMTKYTVLIIMIAACMSGCKQEKHTHKDGMTPHEHAQGHKKHGEHNHANKHMHKKSLEELAESFESPERLKTQRPYEVISMFGDINGKKIMDLGAGTGYFTFKLIEKGATVIAADVDDEFQDFVKSKMKELNVSDDKLELRKIPYDDPSLEAQEVDGIIVVNTYHHIDDRKRYFRKVKAGLKDDGMLMIVDFKKEEFEEEVPGPPIEMRISPEMVMDELSVAGFSRVDINTSLLPYQYLVRAFK